MQVRDRFRVPPPHVALHCDHAFQSVHLPSTMKKSGVDVKGMIACCEQFDLRHGVIYQLYFYEFLRPKTKVSALQAKNKK